MLQIKNLNYYIGGRQLLSEVNWIINPGRHIALIGPNGAGKTTLLRIISGQLASDTGELLKPREYEIGYLPQEEVSLAMGPILEGVMQGARKLLALSEEIKSIHRQLENRTDGGRNLLDRLGELEERFNRMGGYRLEADARAILAGLGFRESDFQRPLADFSGGWRMRVYLARLLLQNPDLLLLDEPSNHLDLESLEWLENYLKTYPGSIITVSHDRFFINRIADEIAELFAGKLTHYSGNYQFYEAQKALHEEQLRKKWEARQAERERIQRFIDRFRYKNTRAAQVQSRIKYLQKLEEIEIPPPPKTFSFRIRVETPSYKEVLRIDNLWFKYDRDWVLRDIHLHLYRGEKVALVGVNGAGKTTLTRLIFGQLPPQKGTVRVGERVEMGYYAQHQVDTLNLNATILEEVAATAADTHRPRVRDILGLFQFSGDDPDKRIGVLSGGEKARVSLAKILLSPVNFLMMDEPTNHLDIASQQALEQALADYDGTLLLISHDRYFLDKLVTRVIELKDGQLHLFEGKYSDYLEKRRAGLAAAPVVAEPADNHRPVVGAPAAGPKTKEQKRREAAARQAISKERNALETEIAACEQRLHELEAEKTRLEQALADPASYADGEKAKQLQRDYAAVQQQIEALYERWDAAQQAYEVLLAGLGK